MFHIFTVCSDAQPLKFKCDDKISSTLLSQNANKKSLQFLFNTSIILRSLNVYTTRMQIVFTVQKSCP